MNYAAHSGAREEQAEGGEEVSAESAPTLRHALVILGSAGCLKPLRTIIDALPADGDVAAFVVVHYPSHYQSVLAQLLARSARISVRHACDGERFQRGHVYVAPSGLQHLTIEGGSVRLSQGPRVHGHVPAGDPLFMSAAKEFGARAIGVVLSGSDANGAAGLAAIKRAGGIAMVQLPREAQFSRMPLAAMAATPVDLCAEAAAIAARVAALCKA
jgi:two-component system chemotaxis response regulator CheB